MKKKVVFVGSFIQKAKDGSVGGQMYACKSLVASSLSGEVDWILLDTTSISVPAPPVYIRAMGAVRRVVQFSGILLFQRPDYTLIFSGNGTSFMEKGLMALMASVLGIRVIFSPRAGALIQETESNDRFRKFALLVFSRCHRVICQGSFWKTYLHGLVPGAEQSKFVIIPNWIDLSLYPANKNLAGALKEKAPQLNLLFMGWIQESKGIYDLLHALDGANLEGTRLHCTFLGDGSARSELMQWFAARKDRFDLDAPGWVYGADKNSYLANADLFVLPSHSEGLPNALMEAMACGIPCIATNVGAVADLITTGENGIMVPAHDVRALCRALETMVHDGDARHAMGVQARKKIVDNHSVEPAAAQIQTMLN